MKVKEIALEFGYSAQHIKTLYDAGMFPAPVKGQIDLLLAAKGIVEDLKKKLAVAAGARSELARSRAGVADVHKRREELKLKKEEGGLVDLKLVENVWSARKAACRQVIEQSKLDKKEREECLAELEAAGVEEFLSK